DAATKAAEVVVIQAELNDQLGVCMKLTGDTSSVSAALDAGRAMAESMRVKCIIDLIPAPAKEAFAGMMGKPEFNPLMEQDVVHTPSNISQETRVSEQAP